MLGRGEEMYPYRGNCQCRTELQCLRAWRGGVCSRAAKKATFGMAEADVDSHQEMRRTAGLPRSLWSGMEVRAVKDGWGRAAHVLHASKQASK